MSDEIQSHQVPRTARMPAGVRVTDLVRLGIKGMSCASCCSRVETLPRSEPISIGTRK